MDATLAGFLGAVGGWKVNAECGPAPGLAVYCHGPAMFLNYTPNRGQSQPVSTFPFG